VTDPLLRRELHEAVTDLRRITDFGLVFEAHLPETVRLPHHGIRRGVKVTSREVTDQSMFEVVAVNKTTATIRRLRNPDGSALSRDDAAETEKEKVALSSLVALAEFGDAIYPGMQHLGSVRRGGDKGAHVVINGENYHVLEALQFTHAEKVDCIYIDPPYNSGARDWKYNNNYVDNDDAYRHSKWLSMMERRLRKARQLLKPDSVLVVTIDENEVSRLGVLLGQLFPDADITLVTIVNNPKGVTRNRLSRVEEYAFFCFFGGAEVAVTRDDLLTPRADDEAQPETRPRWKGLLRSGSNALRTDHWTFFYPIFIDAETHRIIDVGEPLPLDQQPDFSPRTDGAIPVWPVRKNQQLGRWMLRPSSLREWAERGFVSVGGHDPKRNTFGVSYLTTEHRRQIEAGLLEIRNRDPQSGVVDAVYAAADAASRRVKTVWHRSAHDAGVGGTDVITGLTGGRTFTYPKSVFAVRDTLEMLTARKPGAVILDFFAGSGTTMHAAGMLNAEDGGSRQTILVTNNEVEERTKNELTTQGVGPGDKAWEVEGIFWRATRPRVEAAVTGQRLDGSDIPSSLRNADGTPMATGLHENVDFFELTYLDAAQIEVDLAFAGIAPLLWLRAGGRGPVIGECLDTAGRRKPYAWTEQYGVLFNTDRWRSFISKLPETVAAVYIVTDSMTEFSHIAGELPGHLDVVRLYERYLATFAMNER
jgi:adenine-specific DNA-methyltransferase